MRILFLFTTLFLLTLKANAAGFVAEKVRFVHDAGYVEVRAGQYQHIPLPSSVDKFEVHIDVLNKHYNDMDVYVCDDRGLREFMSGQSFRCHGAQRGRDKFTFEAPGRGAGGNHLLFNNSFSVMLTKKVNYEVVVVNTLEPGRRAVLKKAMSDISSLIQRTFEAPEFDIGIKPCGNVNAYSRSDTGDIVICSELFIQEIRNKRNGSISGIIFHEIGHSLLNLWNIPGNANEELVDEFAIVMLHLTGSQGTAYQMAEYFAEVDAVQDALSKVYRDTRHPLSAQRVRNIKRIINNPRPVIERWNQILYPRMTAEGLQNLIDTNPMYADQALAKKLINKKK